MDNLLEQAHTPSPGQGVMLTFYVSLVDLDFIGNKIWKRKDVVPASACLLHQTGQETSLKVDLLKLQDPEGQHHPPSSTFHTDI